MDELVDELVNEALDGSSDGGGGLLLGILIGFVAGLIVGIMAQTETGAQVRGKARERVGDVDLSGVKERVPSAAVAAVNRSPLPVNIGNGSDDDEAPADTEAADPQPNGGTAVS